MVFVRGAEYRFYMEHRCSSRVQVDIAVRLMVQPMNTKAGRIINISASGALVNSLCDWTLSSHLDVLIMPLRANQYAPMVRACIVRRKDGNMGIEWCEFAPPTICELLDMIRECPSTVRLPN
jgi:hypothetical protein